MSNTSAPWSFCKLGDLGTVIRGASPRPQGDPRYYGGHVPRLMVKDVTRDKKYVTPQIDFLTEEGAKLSRPVKKGTLTIVCSGTVGVPAILAVDACIHDGFLAITNLKPEWDTEFLYQLLLREQQRFDKSATHGGVFTNLTTEIVKEFEIPAPPLKEQRRIAEILGSWDKAIELVERLIEEKQQLKRAWAQRLLVSKHRIGTGRQDSKWMTLSAEQIFTVRSERKHGDKPVLSVTQDQGVVIRDSLDRRIAMTESDPNNFKLVRKGDFVISLRSFQGGLECSEIEGIVSPAYHVIYPKIPISQSYFRHLFKSYWFIGHLATAVIGIRDGKQISFQDFEFMELPFPPIEEQERIGRFMDTLNVEQSLFNEQLKALTEQKRGLMQRLLTGKIRVKV